VDILQLYRKQKQLDDDWFTDDTKDQAKKLAPFLLEYGHLQDLMTLLLRHREWSEPDKLKLTVSVGCIILCSTKHSFDDMLTEFTKISKRVGSFKVDKAAAMQMVNPALTKYVPISQDFDGYFRLLNWMCEKANPNPAQFKKEFIKMMNFLHLDKRQYEHKVSNNVTLKEDAPPPKEPEVSLSDTVEFHPFKQNLHELKRYLPTTIGWLNKNQKQLITKLQADKSFADTFGRSNKEITLKAVQEFEKNLQTHKFNVRRVPYYDYQRTFDQPHSQVVLCIIANQKMIGEMKDRDAYQVFEQVNGSSEVSGHPYSKNQIGWVRLELDLENKVLFIDEIQSDIQVMAHIINHGSVEKVKEVFMTDSDSQAHSIKSQYSEATLALEDILKDFHDIAMQVITEFANANGFTDIYKHSFESAQSSRTTPPPKSVYEKTRKDHFFKVTPGKVLTLSDTFLHRKAMALHVLTAARKILQ
jgi:hypothetical protein